MMRLVRGSFLLISVLCVFGLLSCSKDDDPAAPNGNSDPEIAAINSMVNEVVLPLVRDVFVGQYLGVPVADRTQTALACEPLDICSGGSAQVCIDPGTFGLMFTACQIGPTVLDGAVNLTTQPGSGSGTVSLMAGNVSIDGDLSFTADATCYGQYFTNFVITRDNLEINMAGSATWCEPYATIGSQVIPTNANFEFVIPDWDRLFDVSIFTEPVGGLEVVVLNANRTLILKVCDGTFTQGNLSCYAGPDASGDQAPFATPFE